MEISFKMTCHAGKKERYEQFITQYAALIEDEHDEISVMANTAAALRETFGFFWVGFYRVGKDNELLLGPFQGSTACYRIKKGRGVCGTAWEQGCTQVVPDVELFPGHIACSSESRSEIVIPIYKGTEIVGVLDIDSDVPEDFDETDRQGLERIVRIMSETLYI